MIVAILKKSVADQLQLNAMGRHNHLTGPCALAATKIAARKMIVENCIVYQVVVSP